MVTKLVRNGRPKQNRREAAYVQYYYRHSFGTLDYYAMLFLWEAYEMNASFKNHPHFRVHISIRSQLTWIEFDAGNL
jgi:hypothetical protein